MQTGTINMKTAKYRIHDISKFPPSVQTFDSLDAMGKIDRERFEWLENQIAAVSMTCGKTIYEIVLEKNR